MEQSNHKLSGHSSLVSLESKPESSISQRRSSFTISDSPLFPFNSQEFLDCIFVLFRSAIPTSLASLIGTIIGLISLRFAGKYGTASELAGASLGFTWASIFCLGFFFSIDQGFVIIASRLFGADRHKELGILYQRNILVVAVLSIPMIIPMLISDKILMGLGLDEEVSVNTAIYLRSSVFSIIGTFVFSTTRFYLISQNIFNVQSIILAALLPVHIFWCYFFVDYLNMPVAGSALAKSITDFSSAVLLIAYIRYSDCCKESWIPWSPESLKNWISHLKETLALGANTYIEWLSFEVSTFIIGALNNPSILGAHGVAVNLTGAIFMIPLGTSVSMQAYIGNAVGEGSKNKAQKVMVAGLVINSIITLINTVTLLVFNWEIARFFVSDAETMGHLQNILIIYSLSHIADSYANCLGGVLRTVGKEEEVLKAFFICYFGVAINAQWITGLYFGYGYIAVWLSTCFSIYMMFFMMLKKVWELDWEKEIAHVYKTFERASISTEGSYYIEMKEIAK